MPSALDVVNQALNELGFPFVEVINQTPGSTLLANKVAILHPEMLLRTDWNFAIKYVNDNTPLTQNISPDFLYNYQLPSDYNRMDRFSWFFNSTAYGFYYRIIDNVIMTNFRPISYYYVVNNADLGVISALYYRALVLYAAAESAVVLTQNEKLARELELKYRDKLNDAIRQNDMDRYVASTPINDFDRQAYI